MTVPSTVAATVQGQRDNPPRHSRTHNQDLGPSIRTVIGLAEVIDVYPCRLTADGRPIYLLPDEAEPCCCADPVGKIATFPRAPGQNYWTPGHQEPVIASCPWCGPRGTLAMKAPPLYRRASARHQSGKGRRNARPVGQTKIRVPAMRTWALVSAEQWHYYEGARRLTVDEAAPFHTKSIGVQLIYAPGGGAW